MVIGLPITRSMGRLICLPNIMAQGDTPVLSWTLDLYANISKGCNGGLESGGRISYLDLFSMLTLEPVSSNADHNVVLVGLLTVCSHSGL